MVIDLLNKSVGNWNKNYLWKSIFEEQRGRDSIQIAKFQLYLAFREEKLKLTKSHWLWRQMGVAVAESVSSCPFNFISTAFVQYYQRCSNQISIIL